MAEVGAEAVQIVCFPPKVDLSLQDAVEFVFLKRNRQVPRHFACQDPLSTIANAGSKKRAHDICDDRAC